MDQSCPDFGGEALQAACSLRVISNPTQLELENEAQIEFIDHSAMFIHELVVGVVSPSK